jgi:hypothetical protein
MFHLCLWMSSWSSHLRGMTVEGSQGCHHPPARCRAPNPLCRHQGCQQTANRIFNSPHLGWRRRKYALHLVRAIQ